MNTILITGINGYLGSNLAKRYYNEYDIIGLEYDCTDLFRLNEYHFEVYSSKYGIPDDLFRRHKIDGIIHTATFYGRHNESNSKMCYTNTYLPLLLLEKAIQNKCKLFINTDTVINEFTNSYSLTKKQFKDWLKFYSNNQLIKVVNLRLDHFYGPGNSNSNFITNMIQTMLRNQNTIPLTNAEQNRDFLYIDDLLKVFDLVINRKDNSPFFNEYNVGSGINYNLKKVLEFIKVNTNSISILEYGALAYRINEIMHSNNDISQLKELGWSSDVSLEDGLLKVIEFEKKHYNI